MMEPSRLQIQTSAAPASEKRARFSAIAVAELDGEKISMQISGARVRMIGSSFISDRLGASQATSITLTPSAVDTGHSGEVSPSGSSLVRKRIIRPWRRECR